MSHSSPPDTHSRSGGIGIDTIYLEFPLAGLPGSLEVAPSMEGFFQTVHRRWKWALQHHRLDNLWIGARNILVDTRGRCTGGILRVRLSVAELASNMRGDKGNLGQVSPARLHEILSTLTEDLEDALMAPGLAARAEVTRLDVFADIMTGHAGQALAVFKDRMVLVSKRAARQGKSFQVGDNLDHVSIARRKGSGRSSEPTVVYDKAKQAGRDDLQGLIRFECVHGTGRRAKDPLSILGACKGELWKSLLGERLLELGLAKDVKLKTPSSIQAAALELVKDGVPLAQAMLYAAQSLDPAKVLSGEKKLARALRENRKTVEARTRIRFSGARTDPTFIRDLWDLIENTQLKDPQGCVPYDDEVSQSLGLRPRDGVPSYDPSSLEPHLPNLDHLLEDGIYELDLGGSPCQPDHHDDLQVTGPPGHHPEEVSVPRPARRARVPKLHPKTGSPTDGPYDLSFLDDLPAFGSAKGLKAVRELQRVLADEGEARGAPAVESSPAPRLKAQTLPEEGDGEGEEEGGCSGAAIVLCGDRREVVEGVSRLKKEGRILSQVTSEGAGHADATTMGVAGVAALLAGIMADE